MTDESRFKAPYTSTVIQWLLITFLAGIMASILGVAAAIVYWAWTL